jgi:hypothetical protein
LFQSLIHKGQITKPPKKIDSTVKNEIINKQLEKKKKIHVPTDGQN